MGGLLSKCRCTSAEEQAIPLEAIEPCNVEISVVSEDEYDIRESESRKTEENNEGVVDSEKASYQLFLLETLNSFRQESLFTDFTIKVDRKDFPVHKNVLAASCGFFKDLLSTNDSSQAICHELAKVEPGTMESVLNFLYTGKYKLDQQTAASVLHAAEILGIQDLMDPLGKHMALASNNTASDEVPSKVKTFNSHSQGALLSKLLTFQGEGLFCDLTLTTGSGMVIPVHKNILAAVSCYFKGLVRSEMKEVYESNVDFAVIDEAIIEELLNFIYSGEISITFDNVRSLLQASDYLLIEHLKRRIIEFIRDSSVLSNFWHIYSLVRNFDCLHEIYQEMVNLVCNHFWSIALTNEFLEITDQDVRWFLSNDDIVASEAQMLESLIRWYKHSPQDRKESFKRLLNLIHMGSIPDLYLKKLTADENVNELLSFSGYKLKEDVSEEDVYKSAYFHNIVLFGLTHRLHYTHSYNLCFWLPFAGPWSLIARIPHNKSMLAYGTPLIYTNSGLYVQVPWNNPKLAFHRNPLTARHFFPNPGVAPTSDIEPSVPMTFDCAAVTMGRYIYLIGGMSMQEVAEVKTVQRYDVEKQSWASVADMCEPRYELTAVNYKDKCIFVFGGTDGSAHRECLKSVERYDPQTDRWSYVKSMHQPRSSSFAFVHDEKIFVIGGERGEDVTPTDCEVYDPLTDDWQVIEIQVSKLYTLKGHPDQGSFIYLTSGGSREEGKPRGVETSDVSRRAGQHDPGMYEEAKITRPYVTCINGAIAVLDFSTCADGQRKADFYFVDPKSGDFRTLRSLFAWPTDISYGAIMPLSRRDMIKALKDYSANVESF
ncbi:kelch-like protein 23 [Oculina patagonica]